MKRKFVIESPAGFFDGLQWKDGEGAFYHHTSLLERAMIFDTAAEAQAVLRVLIGCRPESRNRVVEVIETTSYTLKEVE